MQIVLDMMGRIQATAPGVLLPEFVGQNDLEGEALESRGIEGILRRWAACVSSRLGGNPGFLRFDPIRVTVVYTLQAMEDAE